LDEPWNLRDRDFALLGLINTYRCWHGHLFGGKKDKE
jgi:hypothetical protein